MSKTSNKLQVFLLLSVVFLCVFYVFVIPATASAGVTYISRHYYDATNYSIVSPVDITENTTWTKEMNTIVIEGWVHVKKGATLTITEGAKIAYGAAGSALQSNIEVEEGGKLIINGTAELPVIMASANTNPRPGDWAYIGILKGASADIDYLQASYGGNWDRGILYINDTNEVSVTNSTFSNSLNYGIEIFGHGGTPSFENVKFARNTDYDIFQYGGMSSASFVEISSDQPNKCIYVPGDNITSSVVWKDPGVPYIVYGWLNVKGEGDLTIDPGTKVMFAPVESALQSNIQATEGGNLVFNGEPGNEIHFTSLKEKQAPGDWAYIYIDKTSSADIKSCVFDYGGNWDRGTLYIQSSNVMVSDCVINNGASCGILIDAPRITPQISKTTISNNVNAIIESKTCNPKYESIKYLNNKFDGVSLNDGAININKTIYKTASPYYLYGWYNVQKGATLTIEPGATILFGPVGTALQSYLDINEGGRLIAEGTKEKINFLAHSDKPVPGTWAYVMFEIGSSGSISNAVFQYGGNWGRGVIYTNTSSLSIKNCTFANNVDYAIKVDRQSTPVITGNIFEKSNLGGVYNNTPDKTVDASSCWWGDATGPNHVKLNSMGKGILVSDGVKFQPFYVDGAGSKLSSIIKPIVAPTPKVIPPIKKLTADKSGVSIKNGQTYQLTIKAEYKSGNSEYVTAKSTWSVSNTSIATVKGGKITAKKTGTTNITAKYGDKTVVIKVIVK